MLTWNLLGFLSIWVFYQVEASDWHADFGPWIVSSKGEPWPSPQKRFLQSGFQVINPSSIVFSYNSNDPILSEAVVRYQNIIQKEGEIGYRATKYQSNETSIRNHRNYLGEIVRIVFDVAFSDEKYPHLHMNESYTIIIDGSSEVFIQASSVWGALRALETFSQLLIPSGEGSNMIVQLQNIFDEPKLSHRGLLVDTSRHFLPVTDILKILDGMAYNKLNVFHWHIIDDNSFPYQSLAFPELSEKGAWHPEMVYTPDDVRQVIEYARLRGIRVMPEFDTPGHVRSWGESHPEILTTCYDETGKPNGELGPMNPIYPKIWEFLSTFFKEVFELFYDRFVHFGGDEVPFDCWESNPEILDYMKKNNLGDDFTRFESAFIQKLLEIPASYGKGSVVWHEVFDNGVELPLDTAVHVWTGSWRTKMANVTKAGHPVLLSACWYLDHIAGGGDWEKYYECDPLDFPGSDKVRHLMLGGEACMWAEFVDRTNIHQRIWPRASATAERLWSHSVDTMNNAASRLEEHTCRMNRRDIPAQPPNGPAFCYV